MHTTHALCSWATSITRTQGAEKHVVTSTSDFQPWVRVIDVAHEQSAWVVCIDACLDAQLLTRPQSTDSRSREIIGFGAGVGSHGENNYTISTEQFSMKDIASKIAAQISQLFRPMESEVAKQVAKSLIGEAKHIGGLSIVKATGPSHYVRDYVAYAMVRKLLPRDDNAFCDEIISLDAFWHWFDEAEDHRRPDLLRLHARIVDGYFDIKAHIIECKLAQQSEGYLERAREQIENGLKELVIRFRPREKPSPIEMDARMPDQRFWWMQLHRLIAGKGTTSKPDYRDTLRALERLSDGFFNITWQATAVAFWTDLDTAEINRNPEWQFALDDQEMAISVATAGRGFVRRVCLENAVGDLSYDDSCLAYKFARPVESSTTVGRRKLGRREQAVGVSDISAKDALPSVDDATQDDEVENKQSGQVPDRILLGRFTTGTREVCWEFGHPDLPNRHMIVFGASGTGKTYTIQALLWELAKAGQNSLIVDYTNGFSKGQLEPMIIDTLRPVQHTVRITPLPINPFRRQCDYIDDQPLPETSAGVARRVSDLFAGVYALGDQQRAALYNAIRDGVEGEGHRFSLMRLIDRLESVRHEGGPISASAASLLSKIRPFVDMNPFGQEDEESWEKIFTDVDSRCHIIQLLGFTRDSAQLITEFSLFDFYWYYRANGNKDRPRVVVLDEIQNLDHRLDSPLGQLLTEGRKFGISLILATQTMSNLGKDERDRLFQASHKLFFKPADTEVRSFAQVLADSTNKPQAEWIERLS
ncbi:MAG TPA: ATP-binding protein, partial [Clostridiaceae bacterium]|nr:ATP-binding protein [Clostridiaceae bacterium]